MKYRSGPTAFPKISEIGFGCWGIGGQTDGQTSYGPTDDQTSLMALEKAFDEGVTFFDTSNVYGAGKSESLIGQFVKNRRDKVVIATKAGWRDYVSEPDFSPEGLKVSLEGSLKRLGTDYVDLLQLHNPTVELLRENPSVIEFLERAKTTGKIRAWGLSMKSPQDALEVLLQFSPGFLQVNFNMLDLRALQCGLLTKAEELGVGIIARTPLSFGFLSGTIDQNTKFPKGDHRNNWSSVIKAHWAGVTQKISDLLPLEEGETRNQRALRFCLSFKQITTTIPGMMKPEEVAENVKASDFDALDEKALAAIQAVNRLAAKDFERANLK